MYYKESDIIARIEALADNVEKEENVHEASMLDE